MTASKNTVLQSVNMPGELICVDIFQRPEGSYGFEEFRRDPEDGRGWYPIGRYGGLTFDNADAARQEARARIDWFQELDA